MKKFIKKALCVLLSAAMVLPLASCSEGGSKASLTQEIESIFTDPSKISYSREYTELKADKTNKTKCVSVKILSTCIFGNLNTLINIQKNIHINLSCILEITCINSLDTCII